jgi:hypothetical protein
MTEDKKTLMKRSRSRDSLASYSWTKDSQSVYPSFSFAAVIQMVNNDPVARGALTHFVDKCMEGDYAVIEKESMTYDRQFERRLDKEFNFRHDVLRKTFYIGKLFQNVFWEIIDDTDGGVKALNPLDSTNIEPITAPNGDPIKYVSKIKNPVTGKTPEWSKDEIVWLKFNDRGTGYAPVDLQALWETLLMKDYVRRYVSWLWKTGQYRLIYNFKSASDKDVDDFVLYARRADENYQSPIIAKGELETRLIRDMKETSDLVGLLKYLDSQIVVNLRVPPIDVGIPDASGRSNADAQSNNGLTHVTSYKKVVEDYTNNILFPRMNKGNSMLRFGPNDRFEEKQVLENVNLMKNMGMTDEAITEYLADRGMFFGTKQLFNEVEDDSDDGTPGLKRDIDTMPSRQSSVDGGAPDEGVSTRPEQVSSR